MEEVFFQIRFETLYDVIAVVFSFLIILHFSISSYYGIKMIILKGKNKFGWCPEMLVTYESIVWVILFCYILYNTFNNNVLIDNKSFGAVFIRPVILLSGVKTAILQKRRYWATVEKYRIEKYMEEQFRKEN